MDNASLIKSAAKQLGQSETRTVRRKASKKIKEAGVAHTNQQQYVTMDNPEP